MTRSQKRFAKRKPPFHVTMHETFALWECNRPKENNGLDEDTLKEMEKALKELEHKNEHLISLVIIGKPSVFCTGLDSQVLERCFSDAPFFRAIVKRFNKILDRLEALPLISIACIDGVCRLGGLELALACDLIVANKQAIISDGHLDYEAMPGGGATRRLPGKIGYSKALHFILQSSTLNGSEAFNLGLVDILAKKGRASTCGLAMAKKLGRLPPSVIRGIKASIKSSTPQTLNKVERKEFQRTVIDRLSS